MFPVLLPANMPGKAEEPPISGSLPPTWENWCQLDPDATIGSIWKWNRRHKISSWYSRAWYLLGHLHPKTVYWLLHAFNSLLMHRGDEEDGPSTWIPDTHMGDPDGILVPCML